MITMNIVTREQDSYKLLRGSPTRRLKITLGIELTPNIDNTRLSLNPPIQELALHNHLARRLMTTYKMCYQSDGNSCLTTYLDGLETDEDAAWHAKNYCDLYGHKLIDIKPIDK